MNNIGLIQYSEIVRGTFGEDFITDRADTVGLDYNNGLYIENLMASLDQLVPLHGWTDTNLIDASGFIWKRYNPSAERFYPQIGSSSLIGYPTTNTDFWNQFRSVWSFVGSSIFADKIGRAHV